MRKNTTTPVDYSKERYNSISKVNAVIRRKFPKIFLARGEGYYYLASDDEEMGLKIAGLYQSGIYVFKAGHLTVQQWINAVQDLVDQFEKE